MKIDFIVVWGILLLISFLPYFLFPLMRLSEDKKLQNKFREEAIRLMLNIDLKENWNLKIIGIDSVQKKLLLVQNVEDRFLVDFIDLNKVKQSEVILTHCQMLINKKMKKNFNV